MPRIKADDAANYQMGSGFSFTGVRLEKLGATEYTLVTIAVDETGSVQGWEKELRDCLIQAVESCKRSPRSDNLLVRVLLFGSQYDKGVSEIHGFKKLSEIDPTTYPNIAPSGMTPLCDAAYSAVGATVEFAKRLYEDNDILSNAIIFIITDGQDNRSVTSPQMVKSEIQKTVKSETLESLVTVLIGVNATSSSTWLLQFKNDVGINQYIDVGEATKEKLAKLAAFVSQSISSQSQALGTGGPSQNIAAVI